MGFLLADTSDAAAWVDRAKAKYSDNRVFGKLLGGVLWTDEVDEAGELLVPADPQELVEEINTLGQLLLKGHDPGFPLGKVLAAEIFTSPSGGKFVAAVLGFYEGGDRVAFRDLGLDTAPVVSSPSLLDGLGDDCWLGFGFDSREVEPDWLEAVLRDPPLRVERTELSHNAAETSGELIRVGLVYLALVWNPLVTSVTTAAGKKAIEGIHRWLRTLWDKLAERRNPVVEIQSQQDGCQISFIFRGKDVKLNYAAHDALPIAAAQAAKLVANMKARGVTPSSLTYEFEPNGERWFPSYALLFDGRLVSDLNILVALEQLPSGLSIGISRGKNKPRLPK